MASNPDVKSKWLLSPPYTRVPLPTPDNLVSGLYQQKVPLKCAHEPACGVWDPGGKMGTLTIVAKASRVTSIWAGFHRVRIPPLSNNPSGTHNLADSKSNFEQGRLTSG